jgi:hypothetical protein
MRIRFENIRYFPSPTFHIFLGEKKICIKFCQNQQRIEKGRPEVLTALLMKIALWDITLHQQAATNIADDMASHPRRNIS